MIKFHYCIEWHLEPIKILKANSSLKVAKICPSIIFVSALNMQFNIFKITMKSNIAIAMEAPFHVNPLTQLWRTLVKAFRILKHSFFQTNKDCNSASVGVSGGWKNIFYPFLYEVKIEELPQWILAHCCWDVFPNILHFEHLLKWHLLWWLKG